MTRIIGGARKGRRLEAPKGLATRPTASRVRQTLFDILAPWLQGARFLDLFAGSGGIGFEALSRGAATVVLVERSAEAVAVLKRNAALLAATAAEVYRQDALVALAAFAAAGRRFDIIYVDPPYEGGLYESVIEEVGRTGLLEPEGRLIAEHFHKRALPETIGPFARVRGVRVGDHRLSFFRRLAAGGAEQPPEAGGSA